MTTTNFDVLTDGWMALYSGSAGPNMANGKGPRLQAGYSTASGETWQHRFYANFAKPADATIPDNAVIDSCTMYMKVRGTLSCWAKGSAPKVLFQRPSDTSFNPGESTQSGECTTTGSGVCRYPWAGGSAPISTNQVFWEGTPAAGDVVSFNLTNMFKAWWAARGAAQDNFLVYGIPSNAAGTAEEPTNAARTICFHSKDADGEAIFNGGSGPYLAVVWHSAATAPTAPTLNTPASGSRLTQASVTRDLNFTYHHPSGAAGQTYDICIATSSHLNATTGQLDTGIVFEFIDVPWTMLDGQNYTASCDRSLFTPPEVRGTTYYWQVRTMSGGLVSPYSTVANYKVNRVPVNTKVRPT